MKLKEKFAKRKLAKRAAQVKRLIRIPGPESIEKVGVLWEPSGKEAFRFLQNHFADSRVILRNLCVYPKGAEAEASSSVLTSKDLDWLGFLKPGVADDFIKTEFDLLLNISLTRSIQFEYITAMSKARFKIGWSPDDNNFFDLNINIKEKQDSLYLARQQIFYLAQLNKNQQK